MNSFMFKIYPNSLRVCWPIQTSLILCLRLKNCSKQYLFKHYRNKTLKHIPFANKFNVSLHTRFHQWSKGIEIATTILHYFKFTIHLFGLPAGFRASRFLCCLRLHIHRKYSTDDYNLASLWIETRFKTISEC